MTPQPHLHTAIESAATHTAQLDLTGLLSGSGGILLLAGGLLYAVCKGDDKPGPKGSKENEQAAAKALAAAGQGLWRATRITARYLSGKELHPTSPTTKRSTATWWKVGRPIPTLEDSGKAVAQLGSVAAAPPRISLTKPRPGIGRRIARRSVARDGALARFLHTSAPVWRTLSTALAWTARKARATARVLRAVRAAMDAWHCWPYVYRAAARWIALAALCGLVVPAWRGWTLGGVVLALVGGTLAAQRWTPPGPSDDALYGPPLWAALRPLLGLPEDAQRHEWLHLPDQLRAEGARIRLKLPWSYVGSDHEKDVLSTLMNSRLPGEWAGRWHRQGQEQYADWTHKRPTKTAPDPEPPAKVDLFGERMQEAIEAAPEGTYILGVDAQDEITELPLIGEESHIAVSVGTGGGKSSLLQTLAVQVIRQRGTVVAIDPKMVSLQCLHGIEGVHIYDDPGQGGDMRRVLEWASQVTDSRFYEMREGCTEFPPLFLFLEECNELTDILKTVWAETKEPGAPSQDPIWTKVASVLRRGRQVNVHVVAVFQDLRDTDFGGVSLGLLFPYKLMGAYAKKQWDRIIGSNVAMPPSERKAGRLVGVKNGNAFRFQAAYAIVEDPEDRKLTKEERTEKAEGRMREYATTLRARHGWNRDRLYVLPPTPSPRRRPDLLERMSRDGAALGANGAPLGGPDDETAGRVSHEGADVTATQGGVTAPRDRLRLVPGQAGHPAQEDLQDPTAPPELLPLAEISRRLGPAEGVPKYDTLRQHKARRDDFPRGVEISGKECYTEAQILAYYAPSQQKNA
ncbi:hypothetical protein [Streptomyces sp. WMMB303]|uniref:hypothetical protein n=1 Tax=Streptomyces sp. WMMB303 TaxID=3034154 RepID=UPI0023ECB82F|nr:hypothetical protein [Streptomyces sp. WMMB303]MDF4254726.1 hypothetical protein [Streptomyces sp. WMMB303]